MRAPVLLNINYRIWYTVNAKLVIKRVVIWICGFKRRFCVIFRINIT
jgi:hypothetical protein